MRWIPSVLLALLAFSAGAAPVFRNPLPIRHGAPWVSEMYAADFNGDGHEDILVVASSDSLNVLLANGTGPFGAPKVTPITAQTGQPGIGDVNGDGKVDVVLTNAATTQVLPMLGNGDGTFTPGIAFSTSFLAYLGAVAVGDFNGDTHADVAVGGSTSTSYYEGAIEVHLGTGAGFSAGIQTGGDLPGTRLKAADFDADGKSDLVAGDSLDNRVLRSVGDGTFTPTAWLSDGDVTVADFNHDAKPDLAIAVGGNHDWYIEVALGQGTGSFNAPVHYVSGYDPSSIDAADVDDDGNLDLLAACTAGSSVTVLRGNADGTFDPAEFFLSGPSAWKIAVADFDRDGEDDFVTADYNDALLGALSFVRGNGDGTFDTYRSFHNNDMVPVLWPGVRTGHVTLGDMNEDGREDVVVVRQRPGTQVGPWELSVMLNDGAGKLAPPLHSSTGSNDWPQGPAFTLGDLNGDGWLDALVVSQYGFAARGASMLGNGDGTFDPPVELAISRLGSPKLGHFNGDANLDLLLPGHDFATVYPGNGNGTFGAGIESIVPARDMLYADLNADGKMDFVSSWVRQINVGLNDGTGHFTSSNVTQEEIGGVALADFDGDGKIDLLCSTYTGTQMRFGNGDGTFRAPLPFTITPVPNYPSREPMATADFDGDGKIDVAFGPDVYLNDGNGGFRSRAEYRTYLSGVAAADMDGSGTADLVFVNDSADDVSVLLTGTTPDPTATATLTLTANKTAAGYAEAVQFEATVTGGAVPLSGVVAFFDGNRHVGLIELDDEGKAKLTAGFDIGAYTITATYTGDENYLEASDTVGLTVTKATPQLAAMITPSPSRFNQNVSIWPEVWFQTSYGFANPTGTITVRADGNVIGTSLAGSGSKVFIHTLAVGSHTISIEYPGDDHYQAVTKTYPHDVLKPLPSLFLETTPPQNALLATSPITIRARFSPTTPTGTVKFIVNSVLVAETGIAGGIAETQVSLGWGLHTVRLEYAGDATWDAAVRTGSLSVKVGPWGTPIQLIATSSASGATTAYWSEVQGAASYKLYRRATHGGPWTLVGSYPGNFTSSLTVPPGTTQLFAVSAVDSNGNESALGTPDLATAVTFTDPVLGKHTTRVKAQHFLELRNAIHSVRAFAGLAPFSYTTTVAAGQRIRKTDLLELRTALTQARDAIGIVTSFTDPTPTTIRGVHMTELRFRLQ
jgi:Bacterial Ig-like domain (group 3)/FG-GAP-like repeat